VTCGTVVSALRSSADVLSELA